MPASKPCALRSTGATTCSPPLSGCYSAGSPSSAAAGLSTPPSTSSPTATCRSRRCWTCSTGWSGRHLEGRETLRRVMSLTGGSPPARARALQAVSLVERPRACIVHPSEQCAAAALHSLDIFESVGDRPRAAFFRLLLAVEGVGANPRHDAAALLAEADREFAALGDDWGQAVAAFVQMETLTKRG